MTEGLFTVQTQVVAGTNFYRIPARPGTYDVSVVIESNIVDATGTFIRFWPVIFNNRGGANFVVVELNDTSVAAQIGMISGPNARFWNVCPNGVSLGGRRIPKIALISGMDIEVAQGNAVVDEPWKITVYMARVLQRA